MQRLDRRPGNALPRVQPRVGGQAVDLALEVEERVDRVTASSATREISCAGWLLRAFPTM
jgi:hypothetical protein